MTHETSLETEHELILIDAVLADLGHMHRRLDSETPLTEADLRALMTRTRRRLKMLRANRLGEAEGAIELTDAGAAVAAARELGRNPAVQDLIRRIPGLMTAQQLAGHPGVTRARMYGDFAAIDGGRT